MDALVLPLRHRRRATATPVVTVERVNSSSSTPADPVVARDDAEELRVLVAEHSEAIYRVARSIVKDAALAEDVTQDTLIKAWQALPTFRGDSSLKSWVLRIAHNTAISTLRRRRDVLHDPTEMPERVMSDTVEQRVQHRAAVSDFEQALDQLDDLSRSIVVMRELEHMSYDDIAESLGVPLPTVKTRLLRARRTLATALGEWKS